MFASTPRRGHGAALDTSALRTRKSYDYSRISSKRGGISKIAPFGVLKAIALTVVTSQGVGSIALNTLHAVIAAEFKKQIGFAAIHDDDQIRYVVRILREGFQLDTKRAHRQSSVQLRARYDPRNGAMQMAQARVMSKGLPPDRIFNMDMTGKGVRA
jgi:hypothetical protein